MDHAKKPTTYNEARKASIMKWRANHRESYNEICRVATKAYYQKNKELIKAKTRARYYRNKEMQIIEEIRETPTTEQIFHKIEVKN